LLAPVFTLLLTACVPGASGDRRVLVSAAASLADVFAEMESAFEEMHPGVDVVLNVAGSAALREQILEGAPTDVFAPANMEIMDQVLQTGVVAAEPAVFARNLLEIAVPQGNPGGVVGLEDFAREELFLGLCAEGVPCGEAARETLTKAGVDFVVDTNEPSVRSLLAKIGAGELDAGITYVTDVTAGADGVDGIVIPADLNVFVDYPIALLAADNETAATFIDFVFSDRGSAILGGHGFQTP